MDDEDVALLVDAIETFVRAKVIDERRDVIAQLQARLGEWLGRHAASGQAELDAARENLANVLSNIGGLEIELDDDKDEDEGGH